MVQYGLCDARDEVFDVVLEEDGFCGWLGRQGRDVVPDVFEVIQVVVVAQRGRVVHCQPDIQLQAAGVVSHGGVVSED